MLYCVRFCRSYRAYEKYVPGVVEMDDAFQAFEEAVVRVGFYEISSRPLVDIPKRRHFEFPHIAPGQCREIWSRLEVSAKPLIDPRRTERVEVKFTIKWILRVAGHAQVVVGEVREERGLTRVDVASCAFGFTVEEIESPSFLRCQVGPTRKVRIKLGTEGANLRRGLIGGNGKADAIVSSGGICRGACILAADLEKKSCIASCAYL